MAPISNASRLADFGTGIGTQGAGITIDNTNDRLGVGTDDPQSTFQVGVGCSISSSGVGTFADSVVVGSAFTANAQGITVVGTVTCTTLSGSGSGITGIATGVSINASGGASQRVMLANASSGVANTMANTGSLYWNDNTSTLYATNVNVSGTMTTEDVANTDAVGLVTAGLGLRSTKGGLIITAGVSTFTANVIVGSAATVGLAKSLSMSDGAYINFGTADDMQIYHSGSHSVISDRGTGSLKVQSSEVSLEDASGSQKLATIGTGITVTGGVNASGLSTFSGLAVTPGECIKETAKVTSTAWNSDTTINISLGNIVYNSGGTGAGGVDLNIVSDVGINTTLKVGEVLTVTGIVSCTNTAHYVDGLKIDHNSVLVSWIGGSAPTEGGGSAFDAYAFTIVKTGNAAYSVVANHSKCS